MEAAGEAAAFSRAFWAECSELPRVCGCTTTSSAAACTAPGAGNPTPVMVVAMLAQPINPIRPLVKPVAAIGAAVMPEAATPEAGTGAAGAVPGAAGGAAAGGGGGGGGGAGGSGGGGGRGGGGLP